MAKRVVVDASLAVDLFVGRDPIRIAVAEDFFRLLCRGYVNAYAPRLFLVEAGGVIVRFAPRSIAEEAVKRLSKLVVTVADDVFYKEAVKIAVSTGSRGADAYYLGLASIMNVPLVTNDRRQADNAERAG